MSKAEHRSALVRVAERLLDATRRLEDATLSDDEQVLGDARRSRERCFEEFRALVEADGGGLPDAARGAVDEVRRRDRRLMSLLRKLATDLTQQRDTLRLARQAVRARRPGSPEPRFVTRRV